MFVKSVITAAILFAASMQIVKAEEVQAAAPAPVSAPAPASEPSLYERLMQLVDSIVIGV